MSSVRWSMVLSHHPPCDYDRTWKLGSVNICVRCVGVATGTMFAIASWNGWSGAPVLPILAAAVPAVLDFTLHELHISASCNARRFLTGVIFGIFVAALLCILFEQRLSRLALYLCWYFFLQAVSAILLKRFGRLEGLLRRYEQGARISTLQDEAGGVSSQMKVLDGEARREAVTSVNVVGVQGEGVEVSS